ncbi:MAG: class II aldolase/adducin family protein [Clostridia bacterium]|nr:class II aldolase/adducin family protein [Clostridia bacterium]
MWNKNTELVLRQLVKDTGVTLLEENLVQGTWGNISVRLDDDHMLVSPTGLDYNHLEPEDMPIVQISDPSVWYDGLKPTSERKIHAAVLASRPEINACIHSHPVFATIMASCRAPLPAYTQELKDIFGGDVIVGAYGLPGTEKLKEGTVEAMQGRNACFMANHGVFCVGETMQDALNVLRTLEKTVYEYIQMQTLEKTGAKEYSDELLFRVFTKKANHFLKK